MRRFAITIVTSFILTSTFFTSNVFADTQVFVDGNRVSNTITKDGTTYVQLRDLSHYIGYDIDYNKDNDTVNFYRRDINKPVVKRDPTLFPTQVSEVSEDDKVEIIKTYELSPNENPQEIPKDSFDKNGLLYTMVDITKSNTNEIDLEDHIEPISIDTTSNDINQILQQLPKEKEVTTADGHTGVLQLDLSTVNSKVKGYKNSTYTETETREYPNLSAMDTSLVPKTIDVGGKTYSVAKIDWQTMNNTAIDYTQLSDNYKAVVKYTVTGTKSSLTGYTTTAEYKGQVSKNIECKTIYTAYFIGEPVTPEPTKEPTVAELRQQLKEAKAREKVEKLTMEGDGININLLPIVLMLVGLGLLGGCGYVLLFRKNVTVHNNQDEKYVVIGKARVSRKNPIIDLTGFTNRVVIPSFTLVIGRWSAKRLKEVNVTINYGASTTQSTILFDSLAKEGYTIDVDF